MYWPLWEKAQETDEARTASSAGIPSMPTAPVSRPQAGRGLLVVEDEETIGELLRSLLEEEQYSTFMATDGADALAQYQQHQAQIQLVVTDITMPTVDGFQLIRQLKRLNPAVKILALSGMPTNQAAALAMVADAFLAKPFELETLLGQIATLVRSTEE